jgi:hypothetical protein
MDHAEVFYITTQQRPIQRQTLLSSHLGMYWVDLWVKELEAS